LERMGLTISGTIIALPHFCASCIANVVIYSSLITLPSFSAKSSLKSRNVALIDPLSIPALVEGAGGNVGVGAATLGLQRSCSGSTEKG
jgi:hypothetical protein